MRATKKALTSLGIFHGILYEIEGTIKTYQNKYPGCLQKLQIHVYLQEAKKCLEIATSYFDNITIDLLFGIPTMSRIPKSIDWTATPWALPGSQNDRQAVFNY